MRLDFSFPNHSLGAYIMVWNPRLSMYFPPLHVCTLALSCLSPLPSITGSAPAVTSNLNSTHNPVHRSLGLGSRKLPHICRRLELIGWFQLHFFQLHTCRHRPGHIGVNFSVVIERFRALINNGLDVRFHLPENAYVHSIHSLSDYP